MITLFMYTVCILGLLFGAFIAFLALLEPDGPFLGTAFFSALIAFLSLGGLFALSQNAAKEKCEAQEGIFEVYNNGLNWYCDYPSVPDAVIEIQEG